MQKITPHQTVITDPDKKNICQTCGTRYAGVVRDICPVCADDRQYIPVSGQQWVSYAALKNSRSIRFTELLPGVYALRVSPAFAIAQKAHLICSADGNLLWDCLPFFDEQTAAFIRAAGGIRAIAISHPHYYGSMAIWAEAFNCPIYLHAADKEWIMDESTLIKLWRGKKQGLWNGMEIIHTGGHFPGSAVLYAPGTGAGGSIFPGDSLYIAQNRKFISMMYSYPNVIPLPQKEVLYIREQVGGLNFDSIYGAFEWQDIHKGARQLFDHSVKRYLQIFK